MKAMVVYDSVHGNTEKIAKSIGGAIAGGADVSRVGTADPKALKDLDLLIIGSPVHGGRPTPAVQKFMDAIPEGAIKGLKVAAFDTRITSRFAKLFGYAADRTASTLQSKGAVLVAPAEGFIVKGTEGPLKEGELERAAGWAAKLV